MCYERESPRREPHDVTSTADEGISLVFGTRLGYCPGAKLLDLIVVARAWGRGAADLAHADTLRPTLSHNPGDFFQPLSALMVVGISEATLS
jgi:hypothetical protein